MINNNNNNNNKYIIVIEKKKKKELPLFTLYGARGESTTISTPSISILAFFTANEKEEADKPTNKHNQRKRQTRIN